MVGWKKVEMEVDGSIMLRPLPGERVVSKSLLCQQIVWRLKIHRYSGGLDFKALGSGDFA